MNKDTVKGAIDQHVGSAKRQIGSMTGNTRTEVEGAVQQVKGMAETAVGNIKDAVHDAKDHIAAEHKKHQATHHEVVIVNETPIL